MTEQESEDAQLDYLIVGEEIVLDFIGWGQIIMPEGISLNRLQATLQVWLEPNRVNWYRLKDMLAELEKKGDIRAVKSPRRTGRQSWVCWQLVDRQGWLNSGRWPVYEVEYNSEWKRRREQERALRREDRELELAVAAEGEIEGE